ncbi:hypothetical protein HXX76_006105 [Chlamydomonas incerta]|uniref:DNA/RNA-binding protein Alba-like domain-containing protein n=1 Tax=Chlamydomonas incerta TaxID=51695 RepID=A0A835W312_CHLIN|nr:hypothetical protein HXX76_006105 [Chlamydomonas incerta]|eukprot:KAG2437455.1 hypothetical protein HXX76_006105 [Chlamydomonas incerta]
MRPQDSKLENYSRVHKPRDEGPIAENEIRVRSTEPPRIYVSQALSLLKDKGHRTIVIKAMGKAINKTVAIAEVVKRRVGGLHQLTSTGSMVLTDEYEPNEEGAGQGLSPIQVSRNVSVLTITFSLDGLDSANPGYQPPLPADQVKPRGAAPAEAGEGEELVLDEVELQLLEERGAGRSGRGGGGGSRGAGAGGAGGSAGGDGSRRARGGRRGRGRGGRSGAEGAPEGAADAAGGEGGEGAAEGGRSGRGRPRRRGPGRGRGAGAAGGEGGAGDGAAGGAPAEGNRSRGGRGRGRGRGRGGRGAGAGEGEGPSAAAEALA